MISFDNGLAAAIAVAAPTVDARVWAAALAAPMLKSGITTPRRIAGFMGQCSIESGGFTRLVENLNYSAMGICATWPSRFPTLTAALPFAHAPEKLANHVYCNRMGNGSEASGDGWRFRGRDILQDTGRLAHEEIGREFGKSAEETADWLETPVGAAAAACLEWTRTGCEAFADAWDMRGLTIRINGGVTALAARIAMCAAVLRALGGMAASIEPARPPEITTPAHPDEVAVTDALNLAQLALNGA